MGDGRTGCVCADTKGVIVKGRHPGGSGPYRSDSLNGSSDIDGVFDMLRAHVGEARSV